MSRTKQLINIGRSRLLAVAIALSGLIVPSYGQQAIVDLGAVDGVDITADNIFNIRVQSLYPDPAEVVIKGDIRYRHSDYRIWYSFRTRLEPGLNSFSRDRVSAQLQYSSGALRELFGQHGVLPFGTYQYCVTVSGPNGGEGSLEDNRECLYRQSEDQFMITLVDPEDDAKLYEYNPLLSWVATYSFSDALSYRLRVAEIKEGQTTAGALQRNNPVYQEQGLMQSSMVYPVYARALKAFQPYAWTVDAYYKGILLGGAQPWKFTIVEDSLLYAVPRDISYLDIRQEKGGNQVFALGKLKLQYELTDLKYDTLYLKLKQNEKELKLNEPKLKAKIGINRYEVDFTDKPRLKHAKVYTLEIIDTGGKKYEVVFRYINPELL